MSKNKSKKNNNNFPYSNVIPKMKDDFKKMIDLMPNDDFINLLYSLMLDYGDFEYDDWCFDEEWEDEAIKFYNKKDSDNYNFIDDDSLPF